MKIPEKVRIGGVDYKVVYKTGLNDEQKMLCGQIEYDQGEIRINPEYGDTQSQLETLLHEIVHGIAYHFSADWRTNEDTTEQIARGLFMVIADNPEMFKPD